MITIIVSLLMMVSVLISALTAFSPNFSSIIESDYTRRAYNNAVKYSLKYGQLGLRSGALDSDDSSPPPDTVELNLPFRQESRDTMGEGMSWVNTQKIKSTISIVQDASGEDVVGVNIVREYLDLE